MTISRWQHCHRLFFSRLAGLVAARLQPHFRKIGDNALLLTGLGNAFAVRRYKEARESGRMVERKRWGSGKKTRKNRSGSDSLNWRKVAIEFRDLSGQPPSKQKPGASIKTPGHRFT